MAKQVDAEQCVAAYDDWIAGLNDAEREFAENAVLQAMKLPHVGQASAKELVVKTFLYCERKIIR